MKYSTLQTCSNKHKQLFGFAIGLCLITALSGCKTNPHTIEPTKLLIFHGDQDTLVPISYSERAVQTFPNATLEILHGEGHMYSNDAVQQTIRSISEFFYSHL